MLHHVLVCITAFVCLSASSNEGVGAINPQATSPLNNFLKEIADFANIVESGSDQKYESNAIKRKDSFDDSSLNEATNEKCVNCGSSGRESQEKNSKRGLGQMGTSFVDKIFGRLQRESGDSEDKDDENGVEGKINDPDFIEEQEKAENVTKNSKKILDEIDNVPKEEEEDEACREIENEGGIKTSQAFVEESEPAKAHALVEDSEKIQSFVNDNQNGQGLGKGSKNDILEIHFYKYLPDTGGIKISPENEKQVLINLRPKPRKVQLYKRPEAYNHIALVSNNEKLVQIPAVKFTVVPGEGQHLLGRRRRNNGYKSSYVSRHGKQSSHFKIRATDKL
jgi:hypothetical protein